MRWNPVYKRELKVSSRSLRMASILLIFNSILAIVALFNMYSVVEQVKMTAEIQYSRFLELYIFVSSIEFLMLMFIMPALTASSVSGERERQTLELMLTTTMSPRDIILGKLWTSLTMMILLAVSALPVQSLVFVYGGITVMDIAFLFLCHAIVAAFTGGIGMFCSSLCKRSTLATVCTYTVLVLLVAGTFAVNVFAYRMDLNEVNSYSFSLHSSMRQASSGGFLYLLLVNPAVTFYAMINGQAGSGDIRKAFQGWFGAIPENFITGHWVAVSLAVQLLIAVLLILAAIYAVTPLRGGRGAWMAVWRSKNAAARKSASRENEAGEAAAGGIAAGEAAVTAAGSFYEERNYYA